MCMFSFKKKNNKLCLNIYDEGIGFNVEHIHPKGTGLGLYGMQERADLVFGQLTIQSQPKKRNNHILNHSSGKGGRI